jgi:hypothetical protein
MILRWLKTHQPSRLEELNQTGNLEPVLNETARAMQADVDAMLDRLIEQMATGTLTAEAFATQRQSAWEQAIENHLPATSEPEERLTKEAQRRLDAEEKRLRAKWASNGLTQDEQDEMWESVRPSLVNEINEDLDAERIDG